MTKLLGALAAVMLAFLIMSPPAEARCWYNGYRWQCTHRYHHWHARHWWRPYPYYGWYAPRPYYRPYYRPYAWYYRPYAYACVPPFCW